MHESSINNLLESILGGKNMSRDRLIGLVGRRSDDAAGNLQEKLGSEDWSNCFPPTKPVIFEVVDGAIKFTLVGSRFTRDGQPVPDAMRISATYGPTQTDKGWVFRRLGELEVEYVEEGPEVCETDRISILRRDKFSLLFADELAGDGFLLPEQFNIRERLRLSDVRSTDAWLQISWKRASNP